MPKQRLIPPHERLGLARAEAAEYIGVSPRLFDEMVADGRMPKPKALNARKVWHRLSLDKAFAELPDEGQDNNANDPWRAGGASQPSVFGQGPGSARQRSSVRQKAGMP